jgi:F-type H+-transporting ATPase subunit b
MRLVLLTLIAAHATTPVLAAGASGGHRFPPFDSTTYAGQLFWLFLIFGALYLLMGRVALPRLASILDERQATIDQALASAQAASKAAEAEALALESALGSARANAQAIAGDARAKSAKDIETTRKGVESTLSARLVEAEARISDSKAKAMMSVDAIATETVASIVEQLGGKASPAEVAKAIAAARG